MAPSPPIVKVKKKRQEQRVFMPPKKWKRLSDIARFQEEAFELSGEPASVSRNDVIEGFLDWAADAFWADKGGEPTTESEWNAKVKKFAEYLKGRQDQVIDEDE